MEANNGSGPLHHFNIEGNEQAVVFIETMHVADGVNCDVYRFKNDPRMDLGVIKIASGHKTPLQKVLKGEKTVEGYVSGKGSLTITKPDGKQEIYYAGGDVQGPLAVFVEIGDVMQWEAEPDSSLVAYEICFPPYEDGRFENITSA